MKVLSNTLNDASQYVAYEMSFSTADIQQSLFFDEMSPEIAVKEEDKQEGEFRLIGDELICLDRQNLPPE